MPHDPSETHRRWSGSQHAACLGLGSNLASAANLRLALSKLRRVLAIEAVSGVWESPAVGALAPEYLNAAVLVRTALDRESLAQFLERIESDLGRLRGRSQTLVPIDIDLLMFDGQILRRDLWDLAYRAVTVAELLPGLRSPETGESLAVAAARHLAGGKIWARPEVTLDAARPRVSRAGAAD